MRGMRCYFIDCVERTVKAGRLSGADRFLGGPPYRISMATQLDTVESFAKLAERLDRPPSALEVAIYPDQWLLDDVPPGFELYPFRSPCIGRAVYHSVVLRGDDAYVSLPPRLSIAQIVATIRWLSPQEVLSHPNLIRPGDEESEGIAEVFLRPHEDSH